METHDTNPKDPSITPPTVLASPGPETASSSAPRYEELREMVQAMEEDFHKFYVQGNKAAGTRVRAAMQALKGFAQTVRTEVQEIKNKADVA